MRQIGRIDTESQARVFRSYLMTRGMHADVEPSREGGWAVWLHEETRLDEGRAELAEFLANPRDEKYTAAARQGQQIEREAIREQHKASKQQTDLRTRWHTNRNTMGTVTLSFMMISIVFYIFMNVGEGAAAIQQWLSITAMYPHETRLGYVTYSSEFLYDVLRGQVWRLVTPIFLHFSLIHILFNMMWLYTLGGMIEYVRGSRKLLLQILLYAVAGNVLQLWWSGNPAFGGMSGVNYGLFAYVWLVGRFGNEDRFHLDPGTVIMLLLWFFLCLFELIPNVANGAHAGGLIAGIIVATLSMRRIPFTQIRF